jgi:cell division protein FtsW (lipid II flippase)
MIALYLALTVGGVAMIVFADAIAEGDANSSPTEVALIGGIYAGLGVVLTILFAVAFVWRKGTGAWIYQIVLIVLGLTSCCTWPATIPLIIYWIKDKDRIIQS